jgi:hypothetical protein
MYFHRKLALMALAGLLAFSTAVHATALAPFIDLTEQGLTVSEDGEGLMNWDRVTPATLNVNVGGTVRFALLYWAGRERPCDFNGTACTFSQPYKDQQMVFNGTPLTGTVIGTESQPTSAGGPILNIGYFADVTAQVAAAGSGSHSFTFSDGNSGSNLWRLDGAGLFVAYTDGSNATFYRVIVWDNLDFAYGDDPTPGETRVTSPVTFSHGAAAFDRPAQLWLFAGDGEAGRPDETTISNNPTLFNVLDNIPDGPQWTTDEYTINIPSNTLNTVVQMHSRPVGQNPDSMLWEMAALRVPLPGGPEELPPAPPSCPTTVVTGPPAVATTTFSDNGSGLASLVVTRSDNADTVVPPFTPRHDRSGDGHLHQDRPEPAGAHRDPGDGRLRQRGDLRSGPRAPGARLRPAGQGRHRRRAPAREQGDHPQRQAGPRPGGDPRQRRQDAGCRPEER